MFNQQRGLVGFEGQSGVGRFRNVKRLTVARRFGSFLEQLMRIAVRRPIADLLSSFFDIPNPVSGMFFLRVHLVFLATKKGRASHLAQTTAFRKLDS